MFPLVGQQVDLDAAATHVVAALFKEFLRSIPGGLLPSSRYTVLVASNDCKDINDRALLITKYVCAYFVVSIFRLYMSIFEQCLSMFGQCVCVYSTLCLSFTVELSVCLLVTG